MRCPNCRKKMEKGYLQSSREILWTDNHFSGEKLDDVVIAERKTFGNKKEAYYCNNCGMLVMYTRERSGLFG